MGAYRRSLSAYEVKVDAAPLLSLGREWRVEVGDDLFAGLEKLFGSQVAELR